MYAMMIIIKKKQVIYNTKYQNDFYLKKKLTRTTTFVKFSTKPNLLHPAEFPEF